MAAHAQSTSGRLELPRPLRTSWPFLALAAAGLLLDATLPWFAGVGIAALFLLAAAVRGGAAYVELRRLRSAADRQILRAPRRTTSEFLRWRAEELSGLRARRHVLRPLCHLIAELDSSRLPGAAPVNRVAARPHLPELREIAERLANENRPLGARGVLLLDELMTVPSSPLYARERAESLGRALHEIRRELN